MTRQLLTAAIILLLACNRPISKTASPDNVISVAEVERIESVLASDDMQGRKAGTPSIDKAAAFIEKEFAASGLDKFNGLSTFRQEFSLVQAKHISTTATINGEQAVNGNVIVITQQQDISVTDQSGYEKAYIKATDQLGATARKYNASGKNMIIVVDTAHKKNFSRLASLRRPAEPSSATQVYVLSDADVSRFSIASKHSVTTIPYANIIGVIPGKSRKDEFVIFSAHYDHLGIDKPSAEGDSIYNGANDDAAGTTAVMMLARYFKQLNNNERTLIFVAFTAEESGGFGSTYFSQHIQPDKVMAMFNIEMIGTESKWGKNSAYITGFDKTDMGAILQKNLEGSTFRFHPDPYPEQNLFFRSDNATLARLGVPAHTISTSKMDVEQYYHKPDDEVETLDMQNMAAIIKAIALSSKGIVAGTQPPSRVKN